MKTRKLLAIVLAVAILASFVSVPVFAEGEGATCETLGILVGTGDGVTAEYLATTASRAQAALINLRLLGLEDAALAFDGEATFTDAADATAFWQPVLEYLKANPSVGWVGYPDGSFMPNAAITGQGFTKVLLVALGYEEGVDFTWETVMEFATEVGLTALADKAAAELTVEDIAVALVEALGTKTTLPTDITLLTKLVLAGVIDEADAVAAGFEVEEEALVIVDAYASSVKTVKIEMSTTVPEGAVVTLKKGTASYATTKTVDGDTITLTALFNLPAGTYTVTVDGESAQFDVVAQHAVDLVIGASEIYDAGQQDLKVTLLDQYGNAMSLTGTNYSVFNQTTGYVFTPAVSTTIKVTPDTVVGSGVAAKAGQEIYVFVYDPVSMLSVSGTVMVKAAPYIAGLEIGGVTIGKIGTTVQTTLFETTVGNVLDVNAVDQYGQAYKLTSTDITTGITYTNKVQILSSNSSIIDPDDVDVNANGDLVFEALNDGTVMITLIIPDQAVIVTSQMITVYALPVLSKVETAGPDEALYANEATDFAVVGYDQYGNVVDVPTSAPVTFTSTVDVFGVNPNVEAKNEIGFTPDTAGTATVYYFLGGVFQGTFDVTVNPAAYPFQITGVDTYAAMEEGTTTTILSADVTVIDQYGRTMTNPFVNGWNFQVMTAAATTLFWTGPDYPGYYIDAATGKDTGKATFVAKLVDDGTPVEMSAYTFDVYNVETEDISGFAVAEIAGTMYTGTTFAFGQTPANYFKTVSISGKYNGMVVFLMDDNGDGLPDLIDLVTSTNDAVEVMSGSILVPSAAVDGSSTIKAWKDGAVVGMADLALSKTAPDWTTTTVKFDAGDTTFAQVFALKDQYGVALSYAAALAANSPDTLLPYLREYEDAVGANTVYSIIKWNGLVFASYTATSSDPLNVTP